MRVTSQHHQSRDVLSPPWEESKCSPKEWEDLAKAGTRKRCLDIDNEGDSWDLGAGI